VGVGENSRSWEVGVSETLVPLLQAGEGYHTEFKQSLDKSFVEEACAFANSGGGKILLGVADNGAPSRGLTPAMSCVPRCRMCWPR